MRNQTPNGAKDTVKRIMDLLASKAKFSFEDMNLINMDAGYNYILGMNFLQYLIEAAEEAAPSNPDVVAALPYLKAWNHHYNDVLDLRWPNPAATYDDPGLTIFEECIKEFFPQYLPTTFRRRLWE